MPFKLTIAGHRGQGCTDGDFAMAQNNHLTRHPENTLPSLSAALTAPSYADWIESDLVRTKDDHLVLIHATDFTPHVAAANRPKGKKYIDEMTLSEVAALKLGADGAARIPTLRALLDTVREIRPGNDLVLNLEIKDVQGTDCPRRKPSLAELALQEIKAADFPLNRIRFSSFSLDALAELARHAPKAKSAMLFDGINRKLFADGTETSLAFSPQNIAAVLKRVPKLAALHPEIRTLTAETVKLAARHNLAIATWCWQETAPQEGTAHGQAIQQAIALCSAHAVPLTFITDFVPEARQFAQQFLTRKPQAKHLPEAMVRRPGW